MLIRYFKNFKKSKTIRAAFFKSFIGVLTILSANLGYFENLMTPTVFAVVTGILAVLIGVYDHYIRTRTTKPLGEK